MVLAFQSCGLSDSFHWPNSSKFATKTKFIYPIMKQIYLLLSLILIQSGLMAQQSIHLKINHKLGDGPLLLSQAAQNNLGQSFNISRVDYYISSVSIQHDGGNTTSFPGVYILSKGAAHLDVTLGSANVTNVESITFSIGVESPVNNEDPAQWPANHPLNYQSPSMHWGWSSGYRFVCLEGQAGASLNMGYQLHGLWNDNYFSQTIPVSGIQENDALYIYLDADYAEALRDINISTGPINHGTNANDLTVLQNFRDHVFSPASGSVSVAEASAAQVLLFPNPTKETIRLTGVNEPADVLFRDLMGREVMAVRVQPGQAFAAPAAGTYSVSIATSKGDTFNQILVVQP
jgi:hypothetical protein